MRVLGLLFVSVLAYGATADVRVTTWNIEHLGTDGRGFPEATGIPRRTDAQLREIGRFIRDTIQSDIVALQEIAITHQTGGNSRSTQLDTITAEMGAEWEYHLPPQHPNHDSDSMYVGFLWDSNQINGLAFRSMNVPIVDMARKALYDRIPQIGYFEIRQGGQTRNDFLLINVHLASGQDFDENHAIAIVDIESRLNGELSAMGVTEADRVILGDFNDNPFARRSSGRRRFTNALYSHMGFKGYFDFVDETFVSTRMSVNFNSIIDHVLVNRSAERHIDEVLAEMFVPPTATFATWRQTFSDHFPISILINIEAQDHDVD